MQIDSKGFLLAVHSNKNLKWLFIFKGFFKSISPRNRYRIISVLILTVVTSLSEVISLGTVVPFIGILVQPDRVFDNPWLSSVLSWFNLNSSSNLIFPIAFLFGLAAIFAAFMRILLLSSSIKLSNAIGVDVGVEVYKRTLFQPYQVHISRSSSQIISGITQKISVVTTTLTALVAIITSIMLFLAILATIFFISPFVASIALATFGTSYFAIAFFTRNKLRENGNLISEQQTNVVKVLQEGLGAIRDVLIDGTQGVYTEAYKKSFQSLQKAVGQNLFFTLSPRYAMESFGMLLIAIFAFLLNSEGKVVAVYLPVLGALALAAQRLMPLLQQLYGNWSVIIGNRSSLADVLELLVQPMPININLSNADIFSFQNEIGLRNLSFQYREGEKWIFRDLNLTIPKGSRMGFFGSTGGGKSTFLDIVMGLLKPSEGVLEIDGSALTDANRKYWMSRLAHVPQSIFLIDGTIEENIAFGVEKNKIDYMQVKHAAARAQIADVINSMPDGYKTLVGERGIRLSGGERQRIAIARALYKNAEVLIFDEATSALDDETEAAVMRTIYELSEEFTILIVAHRLTTLRNCSQIVELTSGGGIRIAAYEDIVMGK
jgi:ATP-binding cassette subfamily B protein